MLGPYTIRLELRKLITENPINREAVIDDIAALGERSFQAKPISL